jgi:threonine dehydrogenase-like Zn-dependent dehydrogenase
VGVKNLRQGDRVAVISIIGCGDCSHCRRGYFSSCDNSNPQPMATEMLYGYGCAGVFGFSDVTGGYQGSHATYVRVPFADTNAMKVPEGVTDAQALFVSDACPTGYMGADYAEIEPGDVVAVWGCGGVGLMAIASAFLMGAERVIAIDCLHDRLGHAQRLGAEVLDYEEVDVYLAIRELTGGRGADRCIECVGKKAEGHGVMEVYDTIKQQFYLSERISALRQAIRCCRKNGVVSVMGLYGGFVDKFPMGAVVNKALTIRSGQQHGQRYAKRLFEHIQKGELDPSFLLTHPMSLEAGAEGYRMFKEKEDNCLRAVFIP